MRHHYYLMNRKIKDLFIEPHYNMRLCRFICNCFYVWILLESDKTCLFRLI